MASPTVADWIGIFWPAVPAAIFGITVHKLWTRVKVLEYRMNRLNGTNVNGSKYHEEETGDK